MTPDIDRLLLGMITVVAEDYIVARDRTLSRGKAPTPPLPQDRREESTRQDSQSR